MLVLIAVLVFPSKATANVEITKTPWVKKAAVPITVQNADQVLENGTFSFERPRLTTALVPGGIVALPGAAFVAFHDWLGVYDTFQQALSKYGVIAGISLGAAVLGRWFYRQNALPGELLIRFDDGKHGWLAHSSEALGPPDKLTQHITSLLFAPAMRLKKARSTDDYHLTHITMTTSNLVGSDRLTAESIRFALEPTDRNPSAVPITTSPLKIRPKTRRECLSDFFALGGKR